MNEKSFRTDVCSWKQKERQNQIMKFWAFGNVHYVYMTSLIFDVIGRLYHNLRIRNNNKKLLTDTPQSVA